jgi:parallel beta-helix repeat protein
MRPDAAPAANTAALQKCLDEARGTTVTIPGADADYQLSGKVTAPPGTSIVLGNGARLRWVETRPHGAEFLRSASRCGIEVAGDNFRLTGSGKLIGPSSGAYVGQEMGIVCVGEGMDRPRSGFEVTQGVEILGWGSRGIAAQFVRNVHVEKVRVTDCGYAGMHFLSCVSGQVLGNVVGNIGPGTAGNAYGISCSHDSLDYDKDPRAADDGRKAKNPYCTGFTISGNTVFDIPLWAGIDHHGAYDCNTRGNKVYNCRHGILLQGGSNAAVDFGGEHNSVTGNSVTTSRMNGGPTTITETMRLGISVNGGKIVPHRTIVVSDNTIDGYGDSQNTSPSIQHTYTTGLEVSNNRITNWRGYGCFSHHSQGIIQKNTFGSVADPRSTACVYVAIAGGLHIIANRLVVNGGRAPMYGVYINTPTDAPYVIEGNDFRAATVQQYAGHSGARLSPAQMVGGHT